MLRVFLILILTTLCAAAAAWMAADSGQAVLLWKGYEIRTSALGLLMLVIATGIGLFLVFSGVDFLLSWPARRSRARQIKSYETGLSYITQSWVALLGGQADQAGGLITKARHHLPDSSLVTVIAAQIARQKGDIRQVGQHLESLLDDSALGTLAARWLLDQARAAGKTNHIARYIQRVEASPAKTAQKAPLLIDAYIADARWQEALQWIEKALATRAVTSAQARRLRGLAHYAVAAVSLRGNQHALALPHAEKAYKFLPDDAPAAILYALSLHASGEVEKAIKTLNQSWKNTPHPALLETLLAFCAHEPESKRFARIEKLTHPHPDHAESIYARATGYILMKRWMDAKNLLERFIARTPTARALKLLASVESAGFMNLEAANGQLERAMKAPAEDAWCCSACGHTAPQWDTHCPKCHHMDSVHWQTPSPTARVERITA